MHKFTLAVLGLAALGSTSLISEASAMPVAPLAAPASDVENVRWVCGPYRCWWRPNYYGYYGGYGYYAPHYYGYYGPRYYGGWGWHRGWHRW